MYRVLGQLRSCQRVVVLLTPWLSEIEIWNALPSTVVAAPSSNVFKQMLDFVDLAKFCIY